MFDQLGAAGAVLQPQLFALWRDEIVNRRAMFALLDPLADVPSVPTKVPVDLDGADQLADTFERLFPTADPAALLTPIAAQVRVLGDALRGETTAGDRRRLLRNHARVAILVGRLAFERLHNSMSARAFFSAAHDDARELGDNTLRATVLGQTSCLAAAEGRQVAASSDIKVARELATEDSALGLWLASLRFSHQSGLCRSCD